MWVMQSAGLMKCLGKSHCRKARTDNVPEDNSIVLEHVTYSYDGKKNALNDISLSIKAGQTVALVGASGGGKTTLANIITRFSDPQKGRILIGNVDIRDIPKETLMNKVSFVFQRQSPDQGVCIGKCAYGKA